jgi:hypothetical protein
MLGKCSGFLPGLSRGVFSHLSSQGKYKNSFSFSTIYGTGARYGESVSRIILSGSGFLNNTGKF